MTTLKEHEGGGIDDGGGLEIVVDGKKKREGGNVRWIHKILADGPQNDDTLLFQANGVKFPSTEAPNAGPAPLA